MEVKLTFITRNVSMVLVVLKLVCRFKGPNGNPAVVQTATWYLDSVLSVSSVQLEHLQTVAAACYWIAQKLHGPVATASRLVKFSNRAFTSKQLMGAEMAILNKLVSIHLVIILV